MLETFPSLAASTTRAAIARGVAASTVTDVILLIAQLQRSSQRSSQLVVWPRPYGGDSSLRWEPSAVKDFFFVSL